MENAIKQFFRSLKKQKTTSAIHIGGYAISMAVLLILVSFIINEKSINKEFANKENIYRIKCSNGQSFIPSILTDDMKAKVPGVEKICLYSISQKLYKNGNKQEPLKFIATNDDFLDIFSFRFIYKASDPTLSVANNVILTKSFSEKLFGDNNPVGESLEMEGKSYAIVGVVTDVPKSASFNFDIFMNWEKFCPYRMGFMNVTYNMYNSFVQLNPNSDPNKIDNQVSGMISKHEPFKDLSLSLQPLNKVYFNGLANDGLEHANVGLIYLLSSIAFVIFCMTVFNYTNLTLSKGYERQTEIGIKKTNGAGRKEIFKQILTESLLLSLFSMIIAAGISLLLSPVFSEILGKPIALESLLSQPMVIFAGILLFLISGTLSGLYPALSFSGISPLQMITGQNGRKNKRHRESLVGVQFLITTVLIISLLFIQKQLDFVKHSDLGFDKEMLVRLEIYRLNASKRNVLENELLRNPDIVSVSVSAGSPMQTSGSASGNFKINGEDKNIEVKTLAIDENFVETFGIEIINGRNLRSTDSMTCLINEHLYKELEWDDLTGKKFFGCQVVGVVKDFHHQNLYTEIGNLQMQYGGGYGSVLSVKIQGNIAQNIDYIKNTYAEIEHEVPLTLKFYDDWIQSMYQKEEKQAHAVGIFAILAIIISCLGLIGTVEHVTNKKTKEIGVRKINGATVSEILTMLNKNFLKWVAISFVIATPIAYYAIKKWLENFAYQTNLSWWIFVFAGLVTLGIALLTVSWQSWKAATRNPVEALRYE